MDVIEALDVARGLSSSSRQLGASWAVLKIPTPRNW